MTQEELEKVLDNHKKWLNDNDEGEARADLSGADLNLADLHGADLRNADLHSADLRSADLYGADLRNADLRDADLCNADLHGADLCNADLHGADLCNACLRNADLYGANIDYSCWPLSCGGLDVHIDDRIAIQLLYHLVRNVLYSKHTSPELKALLGTPEITTMANRFHRVNECGEIKI